MVAAVLIILGASMKIMGEPISNLDPFSGNSEDSFDEHFIKAETPFFFRTSQFKLLSWTPKNGFVIAQEEKEKAMYSPPNLKLQNAHQ